MTKIDIKTEDVKKKALPHLEEALGKIESASSMSASLNKITDLKKVDLLINGQKEKLEIIIKQIQTNIDSYEVLDSENISYINKCNVENIEILNK